LTCPEKWGGVARESLKFMSELLQPPTLPVWKITATNCGALIPLDEFNSQFSLKIQAREAATRFIEKFKNLREDFQIVMNPDSKDEAPAIGTILLASQKDDTNREPFQVLTYLAFADCGCQEEATKMYQTFQKQLAELEVKRQENKKKDAADMEMFAQLKKDFPPIPSKKPKKPKKNP